MRILLLLTTLSLVAQTCFAKIEAVIGNVPLEKNANLVALPSVSSPEVIISRDEYVISYNKERRSANWVAWKVDAQAMGDAARTNYFKIDKELQEYLKQDPQSPPVVTPQDYKGTCFDRGHQAPSADRTESRDSNRTTFVMSNMLPQTPFLNRYLWRKLEQFTRNLVARGKTVYVVSGPIYDQNFGAIGENGDIPVPSKLFKIIFVRDKNKTQSLSVVMPNIVNNGDEPTNREALCQDTGGPTTAVSKEWSDYKSDVTDIQKMAGLEFDPVAH